MCSSLRFGASGSAARSPGAEQAAGRGAEEDAPEDEGGLAAEPEVGEAGGHSEGGGRGHERCVGDGNERCEGQEERRWAEHRAEEPGHSHDAGAPCGRPWMLHGLRRSGVTWISPVVVIE